MAVAFLAAAGSIWAISARPGASPLGGMSDYATRWEFNSLLYPVIERLMEVGAIPERVKSVFLAGKEAIGHPAWSEAFFPFFYSGFFARAFIAVLLAAVLVAIAWRVADTETAVFASLGALLLASPTLYPWYLLWILPFAARRREPAFLWLATAAPLSYALADPASGFPPALVYAAEYGPFLFLLAASLLRARRARRVPA
jgi:hypothetical protein